MSENYEQLLRELKHPKTGKPLHIRLAFNEWICQIVVENKRWSTVYHSKPPVGMPTFIAASKEIAELLTWQDAYEDAVAWLPTLLQKPDTQDSVSF